MQNNNRKVFENIISRTKIYLGIILILMIIICIENYNMILPSIIVFLLVMAYTYYANKKRKSETNSKRHYSAPEAYNAFLYRIAVIVQEGGTI